MFTTTARPGDLKPLHSSSIGKTLLATMKPRARADVLAKLPLDAMTDRSEWPSSAASNGYHMRLIPTRCYQPSDAPAGNIVG
jgi:DNA-binding IclR family transcriptional regulator